MTYRPRGMPARFMIGAPENVRRDVIDILDNGPDAALRYDVIFRPEPDAPEIVGLDFGDDMRGCHFFLKPHEMRAYRARNRLRRVAWLDLPERVRSNIRHYLREE